MTIRLRAWTTGGILFATFLVSASNGAAQNDSPTLTTLYSFRGQYSEPRDGSQPLGGLAVGSGGTLYGTTIFGGAYGICVPGCGQPGFGMVFALTPPAGPGGTWSETVLLYFRGGKEGSNPTAGVAIGKRGVLYGTTLYNGYTGCGTVFALTPPELPGGA
jgi:hypothetical protein